MFCRILTLFLLLPSLLSCRCFSTVIWDAGHGSPDGGSSGQSGTLEKDITLNMALVAHEMSIFTGIASLLTRSDDEAIYSPGAETIRQKKVSDLQNRLSIAQTTENPIFVSIHTNAAAAGIGGLQVFYAPSASSDVLGMALTEEFSSHLNLQRVRQPAKAPNHVYLTRHLDCPAVIVEYGFITNLREEGLFLQPSYRKKLAFLTLCGILKYMNYKGA